MKKIILMMTVLLVSQMASAGYTRNVVATCNTVIGGNEAAERQVYEVKTIEVVSYTSDGPDSNLTIETKDFQSGFNLDCAKRPAGLRSISECRDNEKMIEIKHTKKSLFSETITEARYYTSDKILSLRKTQASPIGESVIYDVILQCK